MKKTAALILIIAISFSIVTLSTVKAQENSWKALAPMPTPRMQLGVAVVNGIIYAIGGSATSPNGLGTNEKYDPATNTWITVKSMPTPRYNLGTTVYENKIYCIGGINTGPHLNITEVYDPSTDTWETKSPLPLNTPTIYCANTVDGKIYVMGTTDESQTELFNEAYDPTTDNWTAKALPSIGVIGGMSCVLDGKIYLVGGQTSGSLTSTLNQIYDPASDTWTVAEPLPMWETDGAAAATLGVNASKRVYVMGGETAFVRNNSTFGNYTDANNIYNPETNTWSKGASMPSVLRFFKLAVINDQLYAIGGVEGLLGNFPTKTECYTPTGYGSTTQEPVPPSIDPIQIALIVLVVTAIVAVIVLAFIIKNKRTNKPYN